MLALPFHQCWASIPFLTSCRDAKSNTAHLAKAKSQQDLLWFDIKCFIRCGRNGPLCSMRRLQSLGRARQRGKRHRTEKTPTRRRPQWRQHPTLSIPRQNHAAASLWAPPKYFTEPNCRADPSRSDEGRSEGSDAKVSRNPNPKLACCGARLSVTEPRETPLRSLKLDQEAQEYETLLAEMNTTKVTAQSQD